MRVERERRFRLSSAAYDRLLVDVAWGPARVVTDVMLGPDGIHSMTTSGWVARLRHADGSVRMQVKKRLGEHEYLETDVGVDSLPAAAETLLLMGLRPGLVIGRTRRDARLPGTELVLDDVSGLGRFVEVEATDDNPADGGPELPAPLRPHVSDADECPAYGDQILDLLHTDTEWARRYHEAVGKLLAGLGLGREAEWTRPR